VPYVLPKKWYKTRETRKYGPPNAVCVRREWDATGYSRDNEQHELRFSFDPSMAAFVLICLEAMQQNM
jgi:hypothetical protein